MSQAGQFINNNVAGSVFTLEGNTGGPVPSALGNIFVIGSGPLSVSGNVPLSTLTIDTDGTLAITYTEDVGAATAALDNLNVVGTENIITTGAGDTITIDLTPDVQKTAIHGWNGSLLETAAITVTSDGAVITLSVEQSGGGDLTVVFSDGFYDWDTTPPATIALTAGSDSSPQLNFVYFLQSTKMLTVSTVGWPTTEHAAIAQVLCQSAASLQTQGGYKVNGWLDHVTQANDQGHITDINYWIRNQNSTWLSGVTPTLTITPNGGSPDNVIFTSASGTVLQLHPLTFPTFSGTPDIYVVNEFGANYTVVTDLNQLVTDSTGASLLNTYFSIVIWGVVNDSTGDCKLMVNLPAGSYSTLAQVTADDSRYADYKIPTDFKSVGFLIAQYNLHYQAAAGGTWTEEDFIDLRGFVPSISPGSSTPIGTQFIDNTFRILNVADNTKEIAFDASSITTLTTRTLAVQDADGIIALSGVANYGTGVTSNTAYAVLCGGTTATNPIQSIASVGSAGQVLTSNGAGALPTFQAAGGGGITWSVITINQTAVVNEGYFCNKAGTLDLALPAASAVGDIIEVANENTALGIQFTQGAGQQILIGNTNTTLGAGGTLTSSAIGDTLKLVCYTANTHWRVVSMVGNWTVV